MIHVKTRIFYQAKPDQLELELDEGSSIETLLSQIKEKVGQRNPGDKISFLNNRDSIIVLLNGMSIYALAGWKTTLQEGDEVSILPMVAGG